VQDGQFFVLECFSSASRRQSGSLLLMYRCVDGFDIAGVTDAKGVLHDYFNCLIASLAGMLDIGIVPTTHCSFLDHNVNAQRGRFWLHNGGLQDWFLLNEKMGEFGASAC
jgi:hypothetical protein